MRRIKKAYYILLNVFYFFFAVLISPLTAGYEKIKIATGAFLFLSFVYIVLSAFTDERVLPFSVWGVVAIFLLSFVSVIVSAAKFIATSYRQMRSNIRAVRVAYSGEQQERRGKKERRKKKKRNSAPVPAEDKPSRSTTPTVGEILMSRQRRPKTEDPLKRPDRDTRTFDLYIENNYTDPLKEELSKIAGQETAKKLILSIIPKLAKERLASGKRHKPVSFLFVGKTGVGKTETAKRVAEALKGVHYRFFRIDANQLRTPESVQSLFGSPRGYVGSDSVPLFIQEAVKSGGKMVILIDEIEKAHPDFITAFMTLLDEGEITYNTTGERVKMNDAFIFITSNLEAERISKEVAEEKSELSKLLKAKEMLKGILLPEVLGRINYVVPFEDLKPHQYVEIIEKKLKSLDLPSDRETALKLYSCFEKEGVLDRGVRETVRFIETLAVFPEELERIRKEFEPASVDFPQPAAQKRQVERRVRGSFDPRYGKRVFRVQVGKKVGVFDGETGELIDRYEEEA